MIATEGSFYKIDFWPFLFLRDFWRGEGLFTFACIYVAKRRRFRNAIYPSPGPRCRLSGQGLGLDRPFLGRPRTANTF